MFLKQELFWMNNKTIIEFGFRVMWRIMEISEGVIRLGLRPRRITPSLISIILHNTQPNSFIVINLKRYIQYAGILFKLAH